MKQTKIDIILQKTEERINYLIKNKKSGKYQITLELNCVQGGISSAYFITGDKEIVDLTDKR
jgi:hypothetical protein